MYVDFMWAEAGLGDRRSSISNVVAVLCDPDRVYLLYWYKSANTET
jgi:hypothetical protein